MTIHDFILSDNPRERIARHAVFWITITVVYAIMFLGIYMSLRIETEDTNFDSSIFVLEVSLLFLDIVFCYLVAYYILPKFLPAKRIATVTILTSLVALSLLGCNIWIAMATDGVTHHIHDPKVILWDTIICFLNSGPPAVCVLFISIKMLKQSYLKDQERISLINANAVSELEILKAQVHPHFLFNTLNNIYSFVIDRVPDAAALVQKLSNTMKYMIRECNVPLVPVKKEIDMLSDYIGLEKVRYGDRLKMEIDISGETNGAQITPLLMIPFVENSFKHGTSKMLHDPWIRLRIHTDDDKLHFTLINGKPPADHPGSKGGIGLSNVKKRLQLLYPDRHSLKIESSENSFTVNMQLPLLR